MFEVKNGSLLLDGRAVKLPQGKWLGVEMTFKTGADKSYTLKISDGAKTLFDGRIAQYRAAAASSFSEVIVAQTSDYDGAYFDIRGISFGETKATSK